MANEEQLSILKQGVKVWNKWREDNREIEIDLFSADLRGISLERAQFSGAHLYKANFSGADLSGAGFMFADLREVDFSNTNLQDTEFRHARLRWAIFRDSNLERANLRKTDLRGVDLKGSKLLDATMGDTVLGGVDLSETSGLEKIQHVDPSHISTNTFALSRGKLPEIFLQGCGLSDWEIEEVKLYDPDLSNDDVNKILYKMYDLRATQALQISPLFISYSRADSKFVDTSLIFQIGETTASLRGCFAN